MDRTFPFWIAIALIVVTPALAQTNAPSGQPNLQSMTPQDAARLNAAVSQSDDATKKSFAYIEQKLKDANHPSAKMLEVTRAK